MSRSRMHVRNMSKRARLRRGEWSARLERRVYEQRAARRERLRWMMLVGLVLASVVIGLASR